MTDAFDVEYDGAWKQDVTECVQRIERRAHEEEMERRYLLNRILIGLYNEAPIAEVERVDESARC